MQEEVMHLDDRGGGAATIYVGNQVWKRVPSEHSPDTAEWLQDTTEDRVVAADRKMEGALEHAYRYPEMAVPVRRCPQIELPLEVTQPVYCFKFGFGEIVAIDSDDIAVRFGKKERHVEKQDLITRVQAEVAWHSDWLTGERKRLEEGKQLFIVKGLCRIRFGEWQAFLNRYNVPRSTADDLIRRYKDAMARKAPAQHLTGYRSSGVSDPEPHLDGDSDADELERSIKEETDKRHGRKPTHHKTWWNLRIELPPHILNQCRKKYKQPGAKKYWRHAAYKFVGKDPDAEE